MYSFIRTFFGFLPRFASSTRSIRTLFLSYLFLCGLLVWNSANFTFFVPSFQFPSLYYVTILSSFTLPLPVVSLSIDKPHWTWNWNWNSHSHNTDYNDRIKRNSLSFFRDLIENSGSDSEFISTKTSNSKRATEYTKKKYFYREKGGCKIAAGNTISFCVGIK